MSFRLMVSAVLCCLSVAVQAGQDGPGDKPEVQDVLLVGNSMTYFWDMPGLLQHLAEEGIGKGRVRVARLVAGGATLQEHWQDPERRQKLLSGKWDMIVLQPYEKAGFRDDLAVYLPRIAEAVGKVRPDTELFIYMDEVGMHDYRTGQFLRVPDLDENHKRHLAAARKTGALLIPACWAWRQARDKMLPARQWYWKTRDGHPSPRRQYLTACMFYAALWRRSPVGLRFARIGRMQEGDNPYGAPSGQYALPADSARKIQVLAWRILREETNDPRLQKRSPWQDSPDHQPQGK